MDVHTIYVPLKRPKMSIPTFSSRMRRKMRDYGSSGLSIALIITVFVYRATKDDHPEEPVANMHRRSFVASLGGNDTRQMAIRERKSFVELWDPSPFEQVMFEPPIRKRYSERYANLEEKCPKKKQDLRWVDSMQLIAVPERQLAVCFVQKAGSTSWHKLVYKMRKENEHKTWGNNGHTENRVHAKNLNREVKMQLMKNPTATRVVCARHPFARLVSGWNNKFHKNFLARAGNVMVRSMPHIVEYFGRTIPADPDHVISFRDFVQYIVDRGLSQIDVHFKSISQLCQPCSFPYNVIVKAETAPADLWWVLNRFNGTMDSFPIHVIPDYGEPESSADSITQPSMPEAPDAPLHYLDHRFIVNTIRMQFKSVPSEVIGKLMDLYSADFKYFGYTFDIETLTAGGFY